MEIVEIAKYFYYNVYKEQLKIVYLFTYLLELLEEPRTGVVVSACWLNRFHAASRHGAAIFFILFYLISYLSGNKYEIYRKCFITLQYNHLLSQFLKKIIKHVQLSHFEMITSKNV